MTHARIAGATFLLYIAAVCYSVNSFALFFSPALSELIVPWIRVPALTAELSLALWLTAKGVLVEADDNREEGPLGFGSEVTLARQKEPARAPTARDTSRSRRR
jgi:hypothetical protein